MTQVTDKSIAIPDTVSNSLFTRDGTKNYKGEPAEKTKTGGWKVLPFIFGAELTERSSVSGASANIISYLVYVKHLHLPYAANMVTNYMGSASLFALLGGFLADTYFGRFRSIVIFLFVQMLGYVVLILNATLEQFKCLESPMCPPAHGTDLALIYLGLYLVALGSGGIRANVAGFGADQFEREDPKEAKYLPHYFNGYFFMVVVGSVIATTFYVYVQNRSWPWGFGILIIMMFLTLVILFSRLTKYRYKIPEGSPFTAMAKVMVAAVKNRKLPRPSSFVGSYQEL